ncbi:putative protein TPRXL [Ixodes scapularis]
MMSTARYAKKRCSVEMCESNTRTAGISLHRFPLDSRRREAWVRFCNNQSLQGKTPWQLRDRVVCSLYFEESALLRPGHLRHNALPSVLPTKRTTHGDISRKSSPGSAVLHATFYVKMLLLLKSPAGTWLKWRFWFLHRRLETLSLAVLLGLLTNARSLGSVLQQPKSTGEDSMAATRQGSLLLIFRGVSSPAPWTPPSQCVAKCASHKKDDTWRHFQKKLSRFSSFACYVLRQDAAPAQESSGDVAEVEILVSSPSPRDSLSGCAAGPSHKSPCKSRSIGNKKVNA